MKDLTLKGVEFADVNEDDYYLVLTDIQDEYLTGVFRLTTTEGALFLPEGAPSVSPKSLRGIWFLSKCNV